jgi:hypothetical protein
MQEWFDRLHAWREFYTFTGAAAATLMGLMFVVMTLGQPSLATEDGSRALRAFFTPTVTFFVTIIVVAMLMLIPDTAPNALAALLGAVAVGGVLYMIASGAHRVWRANDLGLDDLMWYVALPYVSYASFGVAAVAIWKGAAFGLYTTAAAMLLLLLVGIRNAWDLVVYNIQRGGRGS